MIVSDGAVFEFVDGALCARWWSVTERAVDDYVAFVDEAAGHGVAMAALWAVETSARPPGAPQRQRIVDLTVRHEDATACVAFVVEGSGLFASTLRGIVTGVNFLARTKKPHHIGHDLAAAADFVATQMRAPTCSRRGAATDALKLVAAHEGLRAAR